MGGTVLATEASTVDKHYGQCRLVVELYRVHATGHARGQDNLAFIARCRSVYDMLDMSARLRAVGYSNVKTTKVGREYE